jgi:hypothetical protein
VAAIASCSTAKVDWDPTSSVSEPLAAKYNWLQFGGDSRHGGNNTSETTITPQNVGKLTRLFQVSLPETIEGAPVVLTQVTTSSGKHDVAYVTTRSGYIVALDAYSGATLWSAQPASTNITMSSPAIDPSLAYVYSAGLDGYIHKYAVGTGAETKTGGWPELSTSKVSVEKDGTAITIGTSGGVNYLYMGVGGYDGDGGDYQGHVTTVNLANGNQFVFNAMCSNQNVHFTTGTPDCAGQKSGIWAKAGLAFDPATNRLYAGTGNGTFAPSSNYWGDTILALNPDGTGNGALPLDSYTPTNYQSLQNSDLDLGSTNVLILPNKTSKYANLALLSGKDALLRIVNLDNMSGQGAAGKVGGELSSVALPTGGEVQNPIALWVNPADSSTWAFIVSPSNGINAVRIAVDGSGNPSIVPQWHQGGGGGGAAVANNVVYYASNNNLHALDPTTGNSLWNNTGIGQIHWQTPAIVNGVVYIGDNSRELTAFAIPGSLDGGSSGASSGASSGSASGTSSGSASGASAGSSSGETALSRTGWVATASAGSSSAGNALDGNTGTRFTTGTAMVNGMWFEVDMLAAQTFNQITMDSAGSTNDYARGYQVFVSTDGTNFGSAIATGTASAALITVTFPTQTARYLKVVQTGAASNWWSIAELNVYHSGGAGSGSTSGASSGSASGASSGASSGTSGETALSRTGWVATASAGSSSAGNALDGNTGTRFTSGTPMVNGMWFQVDMLAARTFNQITMNSAGSANDYARGYQVFVSTDGTNFGSAIATGTGSAALITVTVPSQTARYLKIVQTGAASYWWSIAELNVYAP